MANSDNVLRAGLTDKHIDVPELMKHVKFEPTNPEILPAREDKEQVYRTPAAEFELTKFNFSDTAFFTTESAAIFFVYDGKVAIISDEKKLDIERGEAVLVMANKVIELKPHECTATVFAVTIPSAKK
jgi:mannose-6-phosphate isomerase